MPGVETLSIVGLYAGLNGLVLLWLALHVGRVRARYKVHVGDGGKPALIRAMRGQANFTEYVPFALIVMTLAAMTGLPGFLLHVMGVLLTAGRVLHGWHFAHDGAPSWMRGIGAGLTMLVILFGCAVLFGQALLNGL
jgi:uncharacterized membrane protein YecN with MAPEG domain